MLNKTLITTTGLALLVSAVIASPGEYQREAYYERRGPMPFEVLDLNNDGLVTAQEHAQVRAERQAARTAQGRRLRHAPTAPRFQQTDSDDDGAIGRDELGAWRGRRMVQRGPGGCGRWQR